MRIPMESRLIALVHKEEPINTWEVQVYKLKDNQAISHIAYQTFEEAIKAFHKIKGERI